MSTKYLFLLLSLLGTATAQAFDLGDLQIPKREDPSFYGAIKLMDLNPDGYSTIAGIISGHSPFVEKIKYRFERSKYGLFLILYSDRYEVIGPIEITLNLTYRKEKKSRIYEIHGQENKLHNLASPMKKRQKEEGPRLRIQFYKQNTVGSANGEIIIWGGVSATDEMKVEARTVDGTLLEIKAVDPQKDALAEVAYKEGQQVSSGLRMVLLGDDNIRVEDTVLIITASRGGDHHSEARNAYKILGTDHDHKSRRGFLPFF